MHAKYTTEGLILERRERGEASGYFSIFTKEFGLVLASAQAVRETKSKLRMNLEELSFAEVTLIRGKEFWKIAGSKKLFSLYRSFKGDKEKLRVAGEVSGLLRRLLHGEEKDQELFDLVWKSFSYCKETELSREEIKNFEIILVLNILHFLGYVGNKEEFREFIDNVIWNKDILKKMEGVKSRALSEINRSLTESQL